MSKPIREGTYSTVAIRPVLTMRQLAKVDEKGPIGSIGIVAREPKWERKLAVHEALAEMGAAERRAALPQKTKQRAQSETLPISARGKHGWSPAIPWHSASFPTVGVLDPFVADSGGRTRGPVVGLSDLTGSLFRYDAWTPYDQGLATSVNGLVAGMMGGGKSMFLKTWAVRECRPPYNRRIIIEGDPKGEWSAVARTVGGQVVAVGGGQYMNLLDAGSKPVSMTPSAWRADVLQRQLSALMGVFEALDVGSRPGQVVQQLLTTLLAQQYDAGWQTTILDIYTALLEGWARKNAERLSAMMSPTDVEEASRAVVRILNPLVNGGLAHAFERASTVRINPKSPMTVFDTGSAGAGSGNRTSQRKMLYTAAMNSAVERLCASRDGEHRIVIAEEGYQLLQIPQLVDSWESRMRLSGDLKTSNWLLVHEIGDIDKYTNQGSANRETVQGILTLSTTQVLFRQSEASLGALPKYLPGLTDREIRQLQGLPIHGALWRVGDTVRDVVTARMTPEEYKLFDTSAGRRG